MNKYGEEIIKNFTENTQARIKEYASEKEIPIEQATYELQRSEPWLWPQGGNQKPKTFTAREVQSAGEKLDQKARSLMLMSARPMSYSAALFEVMRENEDLAAQAVAIPVDE